MTAFHETHLQRPIRALGLTIEGTSLAPLVEEARRELERAGLSRLSPHFYLSTEWGVPTDTVALAIPFYLARPELVALHAERDGHVEGTGAADILRYLRHELGHVVNYAYRLYDRADWVERFGTITQPYVEEYRPLPFSRRFVRHLPGWYAQKHPDEDWAETFAVWLTPEGQRGGHWRDEYRDWPTAISKLTYCDRVIAEIQDRNPLVTAVDGDEDVSELEMSLDDFYRDPGDPGELPPGLDGALRAIFDRDPRLDADLRSLATRPTHSDRPASSLLGRIERELAANVYRWTGHFPERTRPLLRQLAARADTLGLTFSDADEGHKVIALTTLVTALAMTHVQHGRYLP